MAATRLTCLTACCLALHGAGAQTAAPPASESLADPARISERVRREADRPYHWIRLQAQRQAPAAAAATAAGAQAAGSPAPRERAPRARSEDAANPPTAVATTAPASRSAAANRRGDGPREAGDVAVASSATGAEGGGDLLRSLDDQPPAAGPQKPQPPAVQPGALSTSASPSALASAEPPDGALAGRRSEPAGPTAGALPAGGAAALSPPARELPTEGADASGPRTLPAPSLPPARAAAGLPTVGTSTVPDSTVNGNAGAVADARRPSAETTDSPASRLAPLKQESPAFPSYWTQRLRRGEVEVKFEVTPDGQVQRAAVVKSSHPQLRRAALEAVQQWRFAPISAPREAVVTVGFDLDQ